MVRDYVSNGAEDKMTASNGDRLAEILSAIRAARDDDYRDSLVSMALVELAKRDIEIHAARAAAVRVLGRGEGVDVDTLRMVSGWAGDYGTGGGPCH